MSELDLARNIITCKQRHDAVCKQILDLQTERNQLEGVIHNLYMQIRSQPIHLTSPPREQYELGERCFICNKPSYYRCFYCFSDNKPCGFCDNHTHAHKREYSHIALFQRIFQLERPNPVNGKSKLTPEQELAELQRLNADLDKRLKEENTE